MTESAIRTGGLPLIRVKMTSRGPQPDDGREEVLFPFPLTSRAYRSILPLSTGVSILPAQSAQITGRSHTLEKIARLMISNAGTAGGAADWIVNALKINDVPQFEDVRQGGVFSTAAPDKCLRFVAASNAMDVVVLVVTYIGRNETGCPFFGALCSTDAVEGSQVLADCRDILPMSTGMPILPTQSAQIFGHPKQTVYKIGHLLISNAGTAGGAADWIVNDIEIGGVSQFKQCGDAPGDMFAPNAIGMFAPNAIDAFVRFVPVQPEMDAIVLTVTYIGSNSGGCPFFGAFLGTVVDTATDTATDTTAV